MERIDPYKNKEKYLRWKEDGYIKGVSEQNSKIIVRYLSDMEIGKNVAASNKKGARTYARLNTIKTRMKFLSEKFEEIYSLNNITKVSEDQLLKFFTQMRNGEIKKKNGEEYKAVRDYVKSFKAFWHWYQKVKRKEGERIDDITLDLDTSGDKPKWVYITEEEFKRLAESAKYEYKVLMWFLYDTGIRAPSELSNVRVNDISSDYKELDIRVSKTFPRKIKLMLCSDLLKNYIKIKNLGNDDYLFKVKPASLNRYFKRLAERVLGDGKSPAGKNYSELTLYDFRHNSCCYWQPRYPTEQALKHRFGWKKSDKILYYSESLGMTDTISDEDLLIDTTKTEIEKQLKKSEDDNVMLRERIDMMEEKLTRVMELTNWIFEKVGMLE